MSSSSNPAVLVLVFNRPEQTRLTLRALAEASPSKVYVSGDGPRPQVASDQEQTAEVWQTVSDIPWSCPVETRRLSENVGLMRGVKGGIDWFFQHEPEGIVIEDDVLIRPDTLPLAGRLLEHGRTRPSVGSVTLYNAVPLTHISEPSATFRHSAYTSSLYWGTWADRWSLERDSFDDWSSWLSYETLVATGGHQFARYWSRTFDRFEANPVDTWDYLWLATNWARGRRTLVTNANFMIHTGFTDDATHSPTRPRWFPEQHDHWDGSFVEPQSARPDVRADRWSSRVQVGVTPAKSIKRSVDQRFPRLRDYYLRLIGGSNGDG